MRFSYRSSRSTSSAPSAEPTDITFIPRLRTRSSLDRFTVSRNRTRVPSSRSSQPEPMEIQTAQALLTAGSSRTPSNQGGCPNYSYPHCAKPASPKMKDADVLASLKAADLEINAMVKSQATPSSTTESRIDMKKEKIRRSAMLPTWALQRDKTLVDLESYDGANSASDETRVPDSSSTSRRNVSGSSTSSQGLDIAKTIDEYNQLALEHGLRPLEFESSQVEKDDEPTSDAKKHVPKFIRKSSSLNKIAIFSAKHFQRKSAALDLQKDILKGRTLQELSVTGVSALKLPPEFAAGELVLPTFLCNLATFLYKEGRMAPGIFRVSGQHQHIYDLYNYYASQYPKGSDAKKFQKAVASTTLPIHLKHEVNDVAALFTKFIRGLPGGLLGSTSLFNALSSIESKFRMSEKASEQAGKPTMLRIVPKGSKDRSSQARLIALAIHSINCAYRKALVIGFLGLAASIGYETEMAFADARADTSELMTYHSLGVVLGPVLVGDKMFVIYPAAWPEVQVTDEASNDSEHHQSVSSKLHVPAGVNDLKDHAMGTTTVMEMLITIWRDVVTELRRIESRGCGLSARFSSRVVSSQSESSNQLAGVEECPLLEDVSDVAELETMSMLGSIQDEAESLGIGKRRQLRNVSGATTSSQATSSSNAESHMLYNLGVKNSHRQHMTHPFVDHPDEHSEQDILRNSMTQVEENTSCTDLGDENLTMPNNDRLTSQGAEGLQGNCSGSVTGRSNTHSKQIDSMSDRQSSSNYSQVLLQETRAPTPLVDGCMLEVEEDSQPVQEHTNNVTESVLASEQLSSACNDTRRWGMVRCDVLYNQGADGEVENALSAQENAEDKAIPSPLTESQNENQEDAEGLTMQGMLGVTYNPGTEDGEDIGIQEPLIDHAATDKMTSSSAESPNVEQDVAQSSNITQKSKCEVDSLNCDTNAENVAAEADASNSERKNSVKRMAQKFEAAQRKCSGSDHDDSPLPPPPGPNPVTSLPQKKQMNKPSASRKQASSEPLIVSSPKAGCHIPKPVVELNHDRKAERSSPSSTKSLAPQPSPKNSSGLAVAVKGDLSPRSSSLARNAKTRALLSSPMKSLSSYTTPSLERMRTRNKNERDSLAPLQFHGSASTSSLRLEPHSASLHPPRVASPYGSTRTPTSSSISLHGTSPLAPARVSSLVHTAGVTIQPISKIPHTIADRPRKELLHRKPSAFSVFENGPPPKNPARKATALAPTTNITTVRASSPATFGFRDFLLQTAALLTDSSDEAPGRSPLSNGANAGNIKPKSAVASSATATATTTTYRNISSGSKRSMVSELVRQLQLQVHEEVVGKPGGGGDAMRSNKAKRSALTDRLVQARLAESVWKRHAGYLENALGEVGGESEIENNFGGEDSDDNGGGDGEGMRVEIEV